MNNAKYSFGGSMILNAISIVFLAAVGLAGYVVYGSYLIASQRADAADAMLTLSLAQERYFADRGKYAETTDELEIPDKSEMGYYRVEIISADSETYKARAVPEAKSKNKCIFTIAETGKDISTERKRACWGL